MGRGVQVRRAPAAAGEKGSRTRWGFLRVQLRSSPLFRRCGGGCRGLVLCLLYCTLSPSFQNSHPYSTINERVS